MALLLPVIWATLLVAPFLSRELARILKEFTEATAHPFEIQWVKDTPKYILIFMAAYGMGIGIYLSTKRNYRKREEHGSARWGNPWTVNRKYRDKEFGNNKILTQHVRIGLGERKHQRNLNVLVVGGSGSGKTRFYAKPNVMQCNSSYVVLDPKGEISRDTSKLLEAKVRPPCFVLSDSLNRKYSHGSVMRTSKQRCITLMTISKSN